MSKMEIVTKNIDQLLLDPNNARKHSKKNLDAIKGSLVKFGQQKPIVINQKGIVIAGNGTLTAAKELRWNEIACVVSNLEKHNEMAYAISDNRTSELASWHDDVLGQTLTSLNELDFDLSSIGFGEHDLKKFNINAITNDDDSIPEITEENKYNVVRGDVWKLGNHRLMCGDSTIEDDVKKLMNGEKPNLMVTDPPYGVNLDQSWRDKSFQIKKQRSYEKKRHQGNKNT